MNGIVYPRPAKRVRDQKTGKLRSAPVRKGERYTDSQGREKVAANDSTWTYQFLTGSRKAGNRKHHKKGGFRTKKEAEAALAEAMADVGKGDLRVLVQPSAETLRAYLTTWVDGLEHQLKPSTLVGYRSVMGAWIVPHIGEVSLRDITPELLVKLYATLRSKGGRRTRAHPDGRPLGPRSVMSVHVLLAMALGDAVETGKLAVKPTDGIPKRQRPRYRSRRQAGKHWNATEAAKFLETVRGDRLFPLWSILLDTGMRRGEVCGLRWSRIDRTPGG